MQIKTQDLTGPALNWAVAEALGYQPRVYSTQSIRAELPTGGVIAPFMPGFRWDQGGPIIEREGLSIIHVGDDWLDAWKARKGDGHWKGEYKHGPTPLIAAMRCFVASRLGDAVEVPEALQE